MQHEMDAATLQLIALLYKVVCALGGALCGSLLLHFRQWRTRRYMREALAREQAYASSRAERNSRTESRVTRETTARLLKIFLHEPRPTLQRLADDSETDFTIKR